MTVRHSLLAILDHGPCYGYQLRVEFERRTGGAWPLNVGQVYTTLDRLERDGLVEKSGADDAGHVMYSLTEAGRSRAHTWLASAVERGLTARDELAVKIAIAATLPGADVAAIIQTQREATTAALESLQPGPDHNLTRRLVVDAARFAAEAELLWLDHCEEMIRVAVPFGISSEQPRRGRPRASTRQ